MITEREIFLTDPEEKQKVIDFLKEFDLTFTGNIDYTMGLFDDNRLIGTGSLGGRVMRDIAISSDYQKKGLTHRIIRNLQGESNRRGITGNQIFTKPKNVPVFEHMGFTKVAVAEPYAGLLERGEDTLEDYLSRMRAILGTGEGKNRGAIVMNCNPFTLGHRSLAIVLLVGVVLLLFGIVRTVLSNTYIKGIWPAGIGVVLVVLVLLLIAGWNNTAYYPSNADLQSSLTIMNSSSSEFTLRTMAIVSLFIPFVLAYIVYVWHAMDRKKITKEEIKHGDAY